MKKNIEWLREQIKNEMNGWSGGNPDYFRGAEDAYEDVKDWLNQLDEPEVLSWEWIDENKEDSGVHYIGYYVPIGRLHDLLVPKQEEFESKIKVLIEAYEQEDGQYSNPENAWISGFIEDLENLLEMSVGREVGRMKVEEERERRLIAEEYVHSNNCSIASNEYLEDLRNDSRKVVRYETATFLERLVYLFTKGLEE